MVIECKDVTLAYEDKQPLFQHLNLTLDTGDFVLIQGPSGSGKSSLLRLLNRLQPPVSGEILVDGRPIDQHEVTALRRRIGYVQQVPVMIDGTVVDNLGLPFRYKSAQDATAPDETALKDRLDEFLLKDVALTDDAQQLSVGQKQRLALIRTLLTQPDMILCDEPTSALDTESKSVVEEWLERLNTEHNTGILMVTHLDFVSKKARPRRYVLRTDGLLKID